MNHAKDGPELDFYSSCLFNNLPDYSLGWPSLERARAAPFPAHLGVLTLQKNPVPTGHGIFSHQELHLRRFVCLRSRLDVHVRFDACHQLLHVRAARIVRVRLQQHLPRIECALQVHLSFPPDNAAIY